MLLFASNFFRAFNTHQVACLFGSTRTGKTRLAFDIASYYLEDGWRLISNTKNVWEETTLPYISKDDMFLDTVVILDEGGPYLRTRESYMSLMLYKGKLSTRWLIPSVDLPHEDLWKIIVMPKFSNDWLGLWTYEETTARSRNKGFFIQVFPFALHGIFETGHPVRRPTVILSWMVENVSRLFSLHGEEYDAVSDLARPNTPMADVGGTDRRYKEFTSSGNEGKGGLFSQVRNRRK